MTRFDALPGGVRHTLEKRNIHLKRISPERSLTASTPLHLPTPEDLDACLPQDRAALRRRRRGIEARRRAGQPCDEGLQRLWVAVRASQQALRLRRETLPRPEFPADLPVSARRGEIAAAIANHQVVVVCGETGSGKSTQLPKICLALGRGVLGRIGHTQPRRIAARSLAARISAELQAEPGTRVGYKVRFHDRVRPDTQVKLMTDGILLAEIQHDRRLLEYDTLIVDEAHERSLNIDFLLGYLRGLLPRRPDLRVIVTSATIDPQRFARHFGGAPVIEVSGRTFPVEVRYRPPEERGAAERDPAMQQAIVDAIDELGREDRGDVLVFLSGEREIRETAETLARHHLPGTEVLPLYARLGPAEQARIFQPHGARRIVLATNVAETSLTVPGIRHVVDAGFARISRYSHRSKVQRLRVERISQASADQRKGRCGRVAPGICIRLYEEDDFASRAAFTEPEILRTNLAAVILQMNLLGFGEVEAFPFVDAPDRRLVSDGYRLLQELQAMDAGRRITPLGRRLARLPVDPRIGRMLLAAAEGGCLREMLIIAAALSVQDPRERPLDRQQAADEIHATFAHEDSDFLTYVNLWEFLEEKRRHLSRNQYRKLCRRHFLSWNRVLEWHDIHQQLRAQFHQEGVRENPQPADYGTLHRALLSGLLGHLGLKDEDAWYQGARGARFLIHPSSSLHARGPKWIVAAERLETTRPYGRICAHIQPEWAEAAAAHLLSRSYSEPHWQSRRGQVGAYERVTLYGLPLVARRRVNYGPVNPAEAREIFIREGLVARDFETRAPFYRHNLELVEYLEHLEAKSRRRGILVDEETQFAFYDERIPPGIYSAPRFHRWLRKASQGRPRLLHMRMADLLRSDAGEVSEDAFPDRLLVGDTPLPLEYHFDPGHGADGVTLAVPLALVNQVSPEATQWLVPGLLEELLTHLLKALPKARRRALVPIPDTVARLLPRIQGGDRPLPEALSTALRELTGISIPEDAWDLEALPEHLRMRFRILDDDGRELAAGRDLRRLQRELGERASRHFAARPRSGLEREGLKAWDFGDLPEMLKVERAGIPVSAYPALVDEGAGVAVRLLDAPENAAVAHRAGQRRLAMLALGRDLRSLRKNLPDLGAMRLRYARAPGRPGADLGEQLLALVVDLACFEGGDVLERTQAGFHRRLAAGRPRLAGLANEAAARVAEILERYQRLRRGLDGLTQAQWLASVKDMRGQLDALVFQGFVERVPYGRLGDYPRYLQALETRLERLPGAAARDRQRIAEMAPLVERWQHRWERLRAEGRSDPRLEEMRWALEELRISLFAQPQRTAFPVSVKRLERRWKEWGL